MPGLALMPQSAAFESWFAQPERPRIVVVGNEKGGSGKSTTAMHMIVGLLNKGYSVGSIDLDVRQATLSHYVQNRARHAASRDRGLHMPDHRKLDIPEQLEPGETESRVLRDFATTIESLQRHAFIVIDTPGSDTFLSRLGHVVADILVTPLNDSFLDLDVFIRLDPDGQTILGASPYAHAVLARADRRRELGGPPTQWIVMPTRLAHIESRNRRQIDYLLGELSKRIGFRLLPGLSERVVYRELFAQGLTVLDLPDNVSPGPRPALTSRQAAREEIDTLIEAITASPQET